MSGPVRTEDVPVDAGPRRTPRHRRPVVEVTPRVGCRRSVPCGCGGRCPAGTAAPSAPGASPTTWARSPSTERARRRHRPAPAHRPADGHLAGRRRDAAPRQPRLRAADPARPAQPDDRRPRRRPRRGGAPALPRRRCTASSCGWPSRRPPATATPAFEHHAELPAGRARRRRGDRAGRRAGRASTSPARHDTDRVGVDLALRPGDAPSSPLDADVRARARGARRRGRPSTARRSSPGTSPTSGSAATSWPRRRRAGPGAAARRGAVRGADLMWWNFVARTHDEIDAARRPGRRRTKPASVRSPRASPASPHPRRPGPRGDPRFWALDISLQRDIQSPSEMGSREFAPPCWPPRSSASASLPPRLTPVTATATAAGTSTSRPTGAASASWSRTRCPPLPTAWSWA